MGQDYKDGFDGFEELLSKEADSLTMYPSDGVWLKVSAAVQPKKKWPALTLMAVFLAISLSLPTFLNYPADTYSINDLHYKGRTDKTKLNKTNAAVSIKYWSHTAKSAFLWGLKSKQKTLLPKKQFKYGQDKNYDIKASFPKMVSNVVLQKNWLENTIDNKELVNNHEASSTFKRDAQSIIKPPLKYTALKLLPTVYRTKDMEEHFFKATKSYASLPINMTIEGYATPSISFREVQDDKARDKLGSQSAANNNGGDGKLRHTPALGMEIGIGVNYLLSHGLCFTTGLQFNERHYYIDAYQNNGLATIAIVQGNHLDTITISSRYSNSALNKQPAKLDNKINQMSIPFGLHWDVVRSKKFSIGISASLQPTMTLNQDVYLVSTDYKNYANGNAFLRKWNINSSFNLKIGYKIGKVFCYMAPQYRIQHLPTYNDLYPIKEYRTDYGLRIGIQKNL